MHCGTNAYNKVILKMIGLLSLMLTILISIGLSVDITKTFFSPFRHCKRVRQCISLAALTLFTAWYMKLIRSFDTSLIFTGAWRLVPASFLVMSTRSPRRSCQRKFGGLVRIEPATRLQDSFAYPEIPFIVKNLLHPAYALSLYCMRVYRLTWKSPNIYISTGRKQFCFMDAMYLDYTIPSICCRFCQPSQRSVCEELEMCRLVTFTCTSLLV